LDEEILGLEVGRGVLRGVRLDSAAAAVVSFAELPIDDPWAFGPDGSVDPDRIGVPLEDLLDALGALRQPPAAVGISIGPRYSGVGSGPSLRNWLRDQAQRLGQDLVFAGDTGVAFAPCDAVGSVVEAVNYVGLEAARVDLAPVAGSRLLDRPHDTIVVGSGLGWRARLRDLEVVEALEKEGVGADAPFQMLEADGAVRQLTGYRQVAVSPGLRAAGFSPGQMAVSVGVALGIVQRSPANLLDGTVVSHRPEPAPASDPFGNGPVGGNTAAASGEWADGPGAPGEGPRPQRGAGPAPAANRPASSGRPRPGPARFEPAGTSQRRPAGPGGVGSSDAGWPTGRLGQDPGRATRGELDTGSSATSRIDLLIGVLAVLAIVLIPIYLFL
jgi:hypothetical protein